MKIDATMITAVIFDLSDVLIRGLTGVEEQLQQYLPYPKDEILAQFRGAAMLDFLEGRSTEEEYLRIVQQTYKWPIEITRIQSLIRENFAIVIPGVPEIVSSLAAQYPLFLLSDHGREWVAYIEQQHPFLALFTARFYSFDLHLRKTNPAAYHHVLHHIQAPPENCLFIDDRSNFLVVAQNVGLQTILFQNSLQLRQALSAHGICV